MKTQVESLRGALIQRLELSRLSEIWEKTAWTTISNAAYNRQLEPAVSVLVTLYNYAAYIEQCLDSVCASQAEALPGGFEIVVINDGSTDHSAQLVQAYLDRHPEIPICLVNKHLNTGLADTRNLGLKLARAPYVFILDADNLIRSNCLSVLYQAIQGSDYAAVYSTIRRFLETSGKDDGLTSCQPWDVRELVQYPYIDAMAMLDRQILLSVGGYSTELIQYGWFGWEDYDLWLKLAQAGYTCHFISEVLSDYRVHSASMIGATNLYTHIFAEYFKKKFKPLVEQYDPPNLLFGYPRQSHLSIEEQQARQIERLKKQISQLHHQLEQARRSDQEQSKQKQRLQSQRDRLQRDLLHIEAELRFRDLELQFATTERDQYKGRLQAIESSKFWQLRSQWILLKNQLMGSQESPFWIPDAPFPKPLRPEPPELTPEQIVKQPRPIPTDHPYERWQQQHEPRPSDYRRMKELVEILPYKPLISILVPTYNTPEEFLRAAIDSVLEQIYPDWELCIADDASTQPHVRAVLEEYAAQDQRIKVLFRDANGHISRSSNSALELATGEFVALLDHDDMLRPEALYEVAWLLNRHPEADMIYSDEDKIDEFGHRQDPFFKPDWCPDSFLTCMYTCHLGVYRRSILTKIGGFRVGYEGSQDYDLVLRFTEATDRIFHIPKVLYHWRLHQQSTASTSEAKPYAYIAAKRALTEALQRRGELATVEDVPDYLGFYHIRYQITKPSKVSIIIPTRDLGRILNQCLTSIFTKTTYPDYEVVLIDNGSVKKYTQEVIEQWRTKEPERFRCYPLDIPFNYSQINNYAASKATGEYLLFLNNDTEVITPEWLEAMVEQAQRPSIGAVGALLFYPDDVVQHAGVVIGIGPFAGHAFSHFAADSPGYFGQLLRSANYSAVTGACLMCRREVFEAVGGFDEALAVSLNDIDLCLKIRERGYYNLFTPHAKLYHHESKSRGYENSPEKQARYDRECELMRQRWKHLFEHDPCYSPHLTRATCDYRIRED